MYILYKIKYFILKYIDSMTTVMYYEIIFDS